MNTATIKGFNKEFIILGPTLDRNNHVLEAIHSLYYLPDRFKLIFTGPAPVDQSFYNEVVSLIEHDELSARVCFSNRPVLPHAAIAGAPGSPRVKKQSRVTGDSPEALASAILTLARQA